jgi:hypothetical protein
MKTAAPEKRNVYISFDSSDIKEVNLLRAQAKNSHTDLKFIDHSIHKALDFTDKNTIKKEIRKRLNHVSVTLVYISDLTYKSNWVEWEVRESIQMNKGILAFYKGHEKPKKIPDWISELDIRLMPWSQASMTLAIEQEASTRS